MPFIADHEATAACTMSTVPRSVQFCRVSRTYLSLPRLVPISNPSQREPQRQYPYVDLTPVNTLLFSAEPSQLLNPFPLHLPVRHPLPDLSNLLLQSDLLLHQLASPRL